MASISLINPKAEIARAAQALAINLTAATGLQQLLSSNFGPKGTTKMLVSSAGDIKITKDGNVLLQEMYIKHPTAGMIARASVAQDGSTGDGTTSTVLLIGELLRQAELVIAEGLHPRLLTEGIMQARDKTLALLDDMKIPIQVERSLLLAVAQTSLRTKLSSKLADLLTDICVDAVLAIRRDGEKFFDLNMIELMEMQEHTHMDSQLVNGLVLDHGGRHVNMPTCLEDAYILTCNVSLELEKPSVDSVFCYKTAEEREACASVEHDFIDQRVQKIIELKRRLCAGTEMGFVVINQKGIDISSLESLAAEGILALRRAKRRNMERLVRACGGEAMNSLDELKPEHLGYAGLVHEQQLGETKYTFIEKCRNPASVTILIRGQSGHQTAAIKDAIRDGLHAIHNSIKDECVVPGSGAIEVRAYNELCRFKHLVKGKARLGVQVFADSLLVIPKALTTNSGFDVQDTIVRITDQAYNSEQEQLIGLDIVSGKPIIPADCNIFDNYCVKKQIISSSSIIACNLLLTDEIIRAGLTNFKK